MRISRLFYACLVVLGYASSALAAADVWDANGLNPPTGIWGTNANWSDNTTPGNSDTATFNLNAVYTVIFNATPLAIQGLTVTGTLPTFTSSGGARTLSVTSATGGQDVTVSGSIFTLGTSGNPLHLTVGDELTVNGGSLLNVFAGSQVNTAKLALAYVNGGGNGTIVVDGAGSQLNVTTAGGFIDLAPAGNTGTLIYRNAAQGTLSGLLTLAAGSNAAAVATLSVESDADLSIGALGVGVGTAATTGTLNINGTGSTLTQSNGANLTVGGAFSGIGTINIGTTADGGTLSTNTGTLVINPFGTVNIGSGTNTGTLNANGDVTIIGGTLTRTLGSTFALDIGNTMTIQNGGQVSIAGNYTTSPFAIYQLNGSGSTLAVSGTTTIGTSGTINIDGGTLNTGTLVKNGTLNFNAGTLSITGAGGLTVGSGGILPSVFSVTFDRTLNIGATTTIDSGSLLTLDGGTLNTGLLVVNGTFNFIAGTLGLTQAGAFINTPIVTGNPSTINIGANNITLGSAGSFAGFNHQGTLNVGAHTVTLSSAGYARLGVLTSLTGGTINAANGVYISGGGNLLGNGAVNARITGDSGSVIEASQALTLGDAASPAGFNYDGELRVNRFTVTLNSSAQAGLGNLTTLGSGGIAGTLNATNGYVVDFAEALTGFGTVNSTNTLAKRAIINGTVQGNSAAQKITLSGYIKGVGTFNNVTFTGTFDPGLSPTLSTVGSIDFGPTNRLVMELGGTTRGSQYDAILASGILNLDGILAVTLINGFNPVAGNSFAILDWASLSGTFDTLTLPALGAGLMWNASRLYTLGTLNVAIAGDYNLDGTVNAGDYVVWRKMLGQTGAALAADGNGSGAIDPGDYDVWRAHFGQAAGSSSSTSANVAIPEPATFLLLMFGVAGWCPRLRCAA